MDSSFKLINKPINTPKTPKVIEEKENEPFQAFSLIAQSAIYMILVMDQETTACS